MPLLKTRKLFISHSWSHSDDYTGLIALLNGAPHFSYANYSVPRHSTSRGLKTIADEQFGRLLTAIASGMASATVHSRAFMANSQQ